MKPMNRIIRGLLAPFRALASIPINGVLMLFFGLVMLTVVGQTVWTMRDARDIHHAAMIVNSQHLPELMTGQKLLSFVSQARSFLVDATLLDNQEQADEAKDLFGRFRKQADALKALYTGRHDSKMLAQMHTIDDDFAHFVAAKDSLLRAPSGSPLKEIMLAQLNDQSETLMQDLSGFREIQQQAISERMHGVEARITAAEKRMWIMAGIVLAVCLLASYSARRMLRSRIRPILAVVGDWTANSMERRVEHIPCKDELGRMAYAINSLGDITESFLRETVAALDAMSHGDMGRRIDADGLNTQLRQVAERINANLDHVADSYRQAAQHMELTQGFETSIDAVVQNLGGVSQHVGNHAQTVAVSTEQSSRQATAAAMNAEQASHNVATVATATEELSASIAEVTRQIREARGISDEAARQADTVITTVGKLNQLSNEINQVVQLISDIAGQTHLLALNATIEAARAGEAGRGFTVVAGEVKALAEQTAGATDQIARQIREIQTESRQSSTAIDGIAGIIKRISQINAVIDEAADEQAKAAREISASVQHANASVLEVSGGISEVSTATGETGHAAGNMLNAAQTLQSSTTVLTATIQEFLAGLRGAKAEASA